MYDRWWIQVMEGWDRRVSLVWPVDTGRSTAVACHHPHINQSPINGSAQLSPTWHKSSFHFYGKCFRPFLSSWIIRGDWGKDKRIGTCNGAFINMFQFEVVWTVDRTRLYRLSRQRAVTGSCKAMPTYCSTSPTVSL